MGNYNWNPFNDIGQGVGDIVGNVAGPTLGGVTGALRPPTPEVYGTNYGSMGPHSPVEGGTFGMSGLNMNMVNPGTQNPYAINPSASGYLQNNSDLYGMFSHSAAGGAFNPNFYDQLKNTQENQLTTSIGNQYASRGLSGSSAEMGGLNNAIQTNQMNWLNRQQGDQMRTLGGLQGLNSQGFQQTMGIQGQYGNFQDAYNQDILGLLGVQQGINSSNNQTSGQMFGAGVGALGYALG